MFCPKCGYKTDDSAAFCQKCGHKIGSSGHTGTQTGGYILKSHESAFIIILGVISLINGGIAILTGLGLKTLPAQTIAFGGGMLDILFGVAALLKQRWAFIGLAIAYALSSIFQVLGIFIKGDIFQAVRANSLIVNIFIAAYYIALLAFSYICQDALSKSEQSLRS